MGLDLLVGGRTLSSLTLLSARSGLLALVTLVAGCAPGSPTAPSGSTLTLSASPQSVSVDGTAALTAELRSPSGQPVVGTSVEFTTSLGTIASPQSVTDSAGRATATFSAGSASGTAVINARSGDVRATAVNLLVGTAAVGRVAITANPPSLPFGGGSAVVTATVTDPSGNPLNGMPVAFTTTSGNLTPANGRTDASGIVRTTIATAAPASVTATVNASPINASVAIALAERSGPIVSISASPSPVAGTPVTFTVGATPGPGSNTTIQNVSITFGDGTPPVNLGAVNGSAAAQHLYARSGSYTVTATAADGSGATTTTSTQLAVGGIAAGPSAPSVSIAAGPNAVAGSAVTFTVTAAAGSSATIQNVSVTFGDGSAAVNLGAISGATTTQHVYAASGTFTASATVTASDGGTATGSTQVPVGSLPVPAVSISASANPIANRAVTFTITATPAAGSGTTIQNVQVNFGDGTPAVSLGAVSGSTTTQHVYTAPTTYTASVTATASDGGTASASTQVVVAAQPPPTVSISASANPLANTLTTFTITAAPAPGSGATIHSVLVNFGDGTVVNLGAVAGSTTTQHQYAAAGTYAVSATATDTFGATATANISIDVIHVFVTLTASANPVPGAATTFTVTVTTSAGVTIQGVTLNYGDGTQESLGVVGATPVTRMHTYAAAGTFTASATATVAGSGAQATRSTGVTVSCPVLNHTFSITSTLSGLLYAWPGGTQTFTSAGTCSVTIGVPSGLISNLSGDTWTIQSAVGYSIASCTLTPQVPNCVGPSSSSDLLGNGRPYCSNAALGGGASTAAAVVQCN